jgi:hypothetical protein
MLQTSNRRRRQRQNPLQMKDKDEKKTPKNVADAMDTASTPTGAKNAPDRFQTLDGKINWKAVADLRIPPRYRVPKDWVPPIFPMACRCARRLQILGQRYARFRKEGFNLLEAAHRFKSWYKTECDESLQI